MFTTKSVRPPLQSLREMTKRLLSPRTTGSRFPKGATGAMFGRSQRMWVKLSRQRCAESSRRTPTTSDAHPRNAAPLRSGNRHTREIVACPDTARNQHMVSPRPPNHPRRSGNPPPRIRIRDHGRNPCLEPRWSALLWRSLGDSAHEAGPGLLMGSGHPE